MTEVEPRFKSDPVPKTPKQMKRGGPVKKKRSTEAAKLKAKATQLWGQYIHARDRVCAACGKTDGKLDAHHIVVREFNATRTDETNGVLLCSSHHQMSRESVHQDPHFAVCLYTRLLGVDGYAALRAKAYDGVNGKFGVDFWRGEIARLSALLESVR